jgi:hypothetical protein
MLIKCTNILIVNNVICLQYETSDGIPIQLNIINQYTHMKIWQGHHNKEKLNIEQTNMNKTEHSSPSPSIMYILSILLYLHK